MAKDPAFLFYPEKFLTGIMFLTNEQVGIYIKLLCVQHQHGGLIDKDSFNNMVGENILLRKKFIETNDGFYNEKLTEEMDKRNKKSNNLSEAAKEVWKSRKIQLYNESKPKEYKSNTIVSKNDSIVIQPLNINKDININKNSVGNETVIFYDISKELSKVENEYTLQQQYMGSGRDFSNLKRDLKDLHAWMVKKDSYPINRKQAFAYVHTWLTSQYYKSNNLQTPQRKIAKDD